MKLHYLQKKLFKITLWITVSLFLVSCGTYQSVYYNDGIYGDSSARTTEKKISVVNEKEYDSYEENYFSKTLDKLENIENNEIFTDVDNYDANDPEFSEDYVNYNSAQPWGYEDNDVIVTINLRNDPFWGGGFNNWGIYNPWAFNSLGWGFNNPWRWRRGFGRPWAFNTWGRTYGNWGFIDPYAGFGAWNGGYLHPFLPNFGITGFRNNRYYANNNFRYGRRSTTSITTRQNSSNTRATSNNRNTSIKRKSKRTVRNTRTNPTRNNNNNSTRRNTSTIRKNNTNTRRSNTSSKRNNTSTRRSSNSTYKSSNSSSRTYGTSSRGTSSRGSSGRGTTSSSRSSSRRNN
ncbi:hypothetical protein [Polaribacter sp.]|uniref:hypothetical protein n=1 Tax=Polaribacter sp. TaxID=1920175 RepID=UPI003F695EEE